MLEDGGRMSTGKLGRHGCPGEWISFKDFEDFELALRGRVLEATGFDGLCYSPMDARDALKKQIKQMMVENLMLRVAAEEIQDDKPLFGPEGLGLDSVDALQLVVALDKHFGLKISDSEAARTVLQSVNSMTEAVLRLKT